MLRAENLQFRRGDEVLFTNLDFTVHAGQRVAVAGRNGAGKSTLFQLLLGRLQPDLGELHIPASWRIGYMEQEAEVTDRPALDYVIDGHKALREVEAELAATTDPHALARLHAKVADLGGYEAEATAASILHGLGFKQADFAKPYAAFSGGWRIRLNLARALMTPCDLLLLDEPTNHLDLETIMWLERWLARFPGTVMMIAHDRSFLDACANHTLYLSHGTGKLYSGNYSSCERQRAEHLEQQKAAQAKRDAQAAHIQQFVDRFRAKASKAKQVQSRIKALERLQTSATLAFESPYNITFQDPEKVSNPLFTLRDVELGYDGNAVLQHVGQTILPGARIGVLGANGAGKSTLLKSLVGALEPQAGELSRGQHCDVGYFAQHQLENLHGENPALSALKRAKPDWREQQCRDYLGRWGFDDGMIKRPIATLSGGEKARLVLALIALERPAVLVLDEPTNHLDLDMRDALAMALQDYAGAVVIVSHDRALLEKSIDDFWVVADGALRAYRGDLADYTTARAAELGNGTEDPSPDATIAADSKRAQRQARAEHRASIKHLRDEVRRLEGLMEKEGDALKALELRLADSDTYQTMPADELDALLADAGKRRTKLERIEESWLEATAALEEAG